MPVLLGASIFSGGLISLAVGLQSHGRSTEPVTSQPVQTLSAGASAPSAPSTKPEPTAASAPSPVAQATPQTVDIFQTSTLPSTGTVQEMVAGDLMCYLTMQDDRGTTRRLGATFEVCEQTSFLNQRVRFFYEPVSVSDCESAEPCGNSRPALLISRMERIDPDATSGTPPAQSADRYTLTNGEWTISVGNIQSWSGVNNTGDLTYNGCNRQNECLQLQGGRMSCRDGICAIGWQNGDYFYSLQSPIESVDSTARQTKATTLTVRRGDAVILQANELRPIGN